MEKKGSGAKDIMAQRKVAEARKAELRTLIAANGSKAMKAIGKGNFAEAVRLRRESMELDGLDADQHELLRQGVANAEALLRRQLEIAAAKAQARAHLMLRDLHGALEAYGRGTELAPDDLDFRRMALAPGTYRIHGALQIKR